MVKMVSAKMTDKRKRLVKVVLEVLYVDKEETPMVEIIDNQLRYRLYSEEGEMVLSKVKIKKEKYEFQTAIFEE